MREGTGEGVVTERVERARRVASESLLEALADDRLGLEEFERRTAAVRDAGTVRAIRDLLADLPGRGEGRRGAGHDPGAPPLQPPLAGGGTGPVRLIHARRVPDVRWSPAPVLWIVATAGTTRVDLTHARLRAGLTELRILCLAGRVEVVVPEGVAVEVEPTSLLPGRVRLDPRVADRTDASARGPAPEDDGVRLRIRALAVAGAVDVEMADR